MSADRSMRKRQIGVVIRTNQMPSSALPTALPELTSGSNSPSTSSVDTMSDIESVAMDGPALRRRQMSGVDVPERSAHVPELARDHGRSPIISGGSTVGRPQSQRSTSSWSTTAASQISGDPSLEESNLRGSVDERKEVETASFGTYICLFHPLDCHDAFEDETEWQIHVLSHFRTHPTPKTARCPICPDTEFVDHDLLPDRSSDMSGSSSTTEQDESSVFSTSERACSAWDRMLSHVATEHYQHGQTLAGSRPDFELMRYMYGRRIITDAQFKAIQLAPAPSSPAYHRSQDGVRASIGSADEPYYAPYSRRREDRMRGQQRGVSLVL